MAFVYTDKTYLNVNEQINEAVGILTMENLIEELVQSDILDEADTKRERRKKRLFHFFDFMDSLLNT